MNLYVIDRAWNRRDTIPGGALDGSRRSCCWAAFHCDSILGAHGGVSDSEGHTLLLRRDNYPIELSMEQLHQWPPA